MPSFRRFRRDILGSAQYFATICAQAGKVDFEIGRFFAGGVDLTVMSF